MPSPPYQPAARNAWLTAMPALFVVLWSTGFIGAKLGLPHAEPFTFLLLRFAILTAVLVAVALATRAPWPSSAGEAARIAVAGLLVHAVYLGGVFSAIHQGLSAGVASLIVGLQPLLTALAAGPVLGERLSRWQWTGIALGLVGLVLVVWERLQIGQGGAGGFAMAVFALLGITAGTLYQKRHGARMDLRTGSAIQFAASAVAMAILAPLLETMHVEWTGEFVFALGWLVVVLSLGAISLLMLMIRRGAAAKVASLFYLVPPVTAVIAYLVFDETLGTAAVGGMALSVAGVALVTRG